MNQGTQTLWYHRTLANTLLVINVRSTHHNKTHSKTCFFSGSFQAETIEIFLQIPGNVGIKDKSKWEKKPVTAQLTCVDCCCETDCVVACWQGVERLGYTTQHQQHTCHSNSTGFITAIGTSPWMNASRQQCNLLAVAVSPFHHVTWCRSGTNMYTVSRQEVNTASYVIKLPIKISTKFDKIMQNKCWENLIVVEIW